jgi:hypothetical protein
MRATLATSRDPEVQPCLTELIELGDAFVLPNEMREDGLRVGSSDRAHSRQTRRAHYAHPITGAQAAPIPVLRWVGIRFTQASASDAGDRALHLTVGP